MGFLTFLSIIQKEHNLKIKTSPSPKDPGSLTPASYLCICPPTHLSITIDIDRLVNYFSSLMRNFLKTNINKTTCNKQISLPAPWSPVSKETTCNRGDLASIPGVNSIEDPLEKEMATLSSILAWEILWTEESGRLQSIARGRGCKRQTRLSN